MEIFKQNLTSNMLFNTILEININPNSKILDLGCGDGNISIRLAEKFNLNLIYGSDISSLSINKAQEIANDKNIKNDFRVGSGFDPWSGYKFDLICCDVAAISEIIADLSDWYTGVSCKSSKDGLALVEPLIKKAREYLNYDGIFIIPCISLANRKKLIEILNNSFDNVQKTSEKEWPMPNDLIKKIHEKGLKENTENWSINEKFGLKLAKTSIYKCF